MPRRHRTPSRSFRNAGAVAAFVLAGATLAVPAARAASRAVRIAGQADLIPGISAQGQVGDVLLENDRIRVVIDDIDHPHGFADTGGNLIDAALVGGEDRLASLFTMFNNTFGRQAQYVLLEIVSAGGASTPAIVRAAGTDSELPSLAVVTEYSLAPGEDHVHLTTTITNNGTAPVRQLQGGDAIQWGLTTHFAPDWPNTGRNIPGDGHDIGGKTLDVDWMASDGLGSSYGYASPAGKVELSNGSTWSDAGVAYLDLPVGGSQSYARDFVVGDGSIASVSDSLLALRGTTTGTVSGTITEIGTGQPVAGATVTFTSVQCLGVVGARSRTIARSDAAGRYSAKLEPGNWKALVEGLGRMPSGCSSVSVSALITTPLDVALSGAGTLAWTCTDGAAPLPCKVSVLHAPGGVPPAGDRWDGPQLGDVHDLVGGYAILSTSGSGSAVVPPGQYQVWVTRGMEWDAHVELVTVTAGGTATVNALLQRVVDTTGWISADLHVHAFNSADSGVSFEIRAQEAACEGLEIVVPTDHDFISDMSSAIASTGVSAWVSTFPGDEVTTVPWGHFNGYPLTPDTLRARNGALDHAGLSPAEIFAGLRADPKDPVVQVNHPRAGGLGYFDLTAVNPVTGVSPDPLFSDDFDAVEVFNGKRLYQVGAVLNDWYHLLNDGHRISAMGNTDTHQVFSQELGYPRNFVQVGVDTPSVVSETAFRDAIKAGRTMFTNGPFVETWIGGQGMGSTVTAVGGNVGLRVRVQAPPWMTVDTLNVVVNGRIAASMPVPSSGTALRLDTVVPLMLEQDSWVAAEVKGGDCTTDASNACLAPGCPGRLDPMIPPLYGTDPVCPYAHANPIYVDVDGDGRITPPGNRGARIEPIALTRPVDAAGHSTRLDEIVTVRGTVSVPSYAFDHRSNLVYFQDASIDLTRTLSGGTTLYQNGLIHPELELGDVIEVTGRVTQFNGLTELEGVSIAVLQHGAPVPDPIVLTVSDLRSAARNEQWEGMLVRVNGLTITGGTWPGFGTDASITVKDASSAQTITLRVDSDTDVDGTAPPSEPFDLIAEVGQYKFSEPLLGFHQLQPRWRADVIEAADPLLIAHGPSVESATSCGAVIRWYTTKPGDSAVEYGATPAYGQSVRDATPVTSHVVTLSGLIPDQLLHYRVTSGGVASDDTTFRTAKAAAPSLLDGPRIDVIDANTAQVRWTTDVPSTSVVDFGTSPLLGMTATSPGDTTLHLVTLAGLLPGTRYYLKARSDSAACGGGSFASALLSFTTPSCRSVRAPAHVLATPRRFAVHVEWDATLAAGEYRVERAERDCGGAFRLIASVPAAGGPTASHDDEAVTPGTTYCYRVVAATSDCAALPTACSDAACAVPVDGTGCPAGPGHVVISRIQVDGAAGGCDELVELYNPTPRAQDLTGWALRYQSAANTVGTAGIELADGAAIAPHGYYLLASSSYSGPGAPDAIMACGLAAAGGHVSLVRGLGDLGSACPPSAPGAFVIDRVGWGTATCPEGTGPAAAPPTDQAVARRGDDADGAAVDTDDNAADFFAPAPTSPRDGSVRAACRDVGLARPVEVSSIPSGTPLLVSRRSDGELLVDFEELADADGYNVYVGDLGAWYGHGAGADVACAAATMPSGAGRRRVVLSMGGGSRYVVVTAFNAVGEGTSGMRSDGREIPVAESTCAP